ncbi:hypothetical protein J6590_077485 [Homalodisca vitripennis]|nr:hypothetical protein J6590_077485 [Homalodisca vitripennis]
MPQETEDGLVHWLRHEYLSESNNWSNPYSYTNHSAGIGVIFTTYNVSSLKYTLRTTKASMLTEEETLHGAQTGNSFSIYHFSGFLTIQAAIDQAYLFSYHNVNIPDNIIVCYLPYVDFTSIDMLTTLFPLVTSLAFIFMMPSLLTCIVEEKSSGIKFQTQSSSIMWDSDAVVGFPWNLKAQNPIVVSFYKHSPWLCVIISSVFICGARGYSSGFSTRPGGSISSTTDKVLEGVEVLILKPLQPGFLNQKGVFKTALSSTGRVRPKANGVYCRLKPQTEKVKLNSVEDLFEDVFLRHKDYKPVTVEFHTPTWREMMKIMGLKPWVNWFNWLIYSLAMAIPVSLIVTAILTTDTGAGSPVNVDYFTLWILFLLFILAYTSLIFCISTFFTNGHKWTMSSLFDSGTRGDRVSVGLASTMLVVDVILYNLITWYMENINPGPYGQTKPPGFIFQDDWRLRWVAGAATITPALVADVLSVAGRVVGTSGQSIFCLGMALGLWVIAWSSMGPDGRGSLFAGFSAPSPSSLCGHRNSCSSAPCPMDLLESPYSGAFQHIAFPQLPEQWPKPWHLKHCGGLAGFLFPRSQSLVSVTSQVLVDSVIFSLAISSTAYPSYCFSTKNRYESKSIYKQIRFHENYEKPPSDTKVGIRIENLRKTFNQGKVVAVENVDLDVYEGNITALLGHNGAGKTTTMSILAGLISPTEGKVIVENKNVSSNLGLCTQHNLLFSYFSVIEHLILFGMLKGLPRKKSEEEGLQLLKNLNIEDKKDMLISKLSGGMKRKLCLSIALIGNPEVLLLDEPTSGLDPESRRQGFRGHRTIIITTHFMEEADVLGDRIAIMDHGQVRCYGTSMFLKKLYNTGYHLSIFKMERAPVPPITSIVEQHVNTSEVRVVSQEQLVYVINLDESKQFPVLFAALDSGAVGLGLTGMSISCSTLEDVFLKVAESPDRNTLENEVLDNEMFVGQHKRVTGSELIFQQMKALLIKRFLTSKRTSRNKLIFMIIPTLMMAISIYALMLQLITADQPDLLISLGKFPGVRVAVSSDNQIISNVSKALITSGSATYEPVPTGTVVRCSMKFGISGFGDDMRSLINNSLVQYERQMIAGFKYNSSHFLGEFSWYFTHSPPIVLNLVANILLKQKSETSSITVSNHPITLETEEDLCDLSMEAEEYIINIPPYVSFLSLGLLVLIISFIHSPLEERVTRAKQLQLMSGVSPLLYWLSYFLFDIAMYLITVTLMIGAVYLFQKHNIYSDSGNISTLMLVLVLLGISGTGYAYFFSFLFESSTKAAVYFIFINLFTGVIASVIMTLTSRLYSSYDIITFLLNFNPIFAAVSALIYLFSLIYINGTCLRCGKDCQSEYEVYYVRMLYNIIY